MKVSKEVIHREIAGEHILIPVGETALRVHGMMTLTETGLVLWKCLQDECSEATLLKAILSEYDVEPDIALEDIRAFLKKLDALGILDKE